jgi:hypothetical protein
MTRGERGAVFVAFAAVLAAVWVTSCVGSDPPPDGADTDAASCATAAEGCACTAGGACDQGLTCASSVCVRLEAGPGTDLDASADAADATDATTDADGGGPIRLTITMNGAQEVPAVTTDAGGGPDELFLDEKLRTVTGTVAFRGLSGPPTTAQVHPGTCGGLGAVLLMLDPGSAPSGTVTFNASLLPSQVADVKAGSWYLNIPTAQHPNGEIRGQILPAGRTCP